MSLWSLCRCYDQMAATTSLHPGAESLLQRRADHTRRQGKNSEVPYQNSELQNSKFDHFFLAILAILARDISVERSARQGFLDGR